MPCTCGSVTWLSSDEQQIVLREVVEQAEGARSGGAPVEVARVVLDAGTVAQLLDHLQIVFHPLLDALRFHHPPFAFEELDLLAQIEVDLLHGSVDTLLRGDEETCGVDRQRVDRLDAGARRGIDDPDRFDFVVVEHHAVALAAEFAEGGHDVHRVAVDAERRGQQVAFGAGVERFDQFVEELLVADDVADLERDGRRMEVFGVAAAVEARDGRDDDHVPAARKERRAGLQTHLFDLVVDRQVFFDEGIRGRQVGLRLVVVVVGDEIFDRVFGKEILELSVELRREGLVMAQYESRFVDLGDDVGGREGLARTRHAQQRVVFRSAADRIDELRDRFGLVARGLVFRDEFEIHRCKGTINSEFGGRNGG